MPEILEPSRVLSKLPICFIPPSSVESALHTLLNTALFCDASVLVKGFTMISLRFLHLPLLLSAFGVKTDIHILPTSSSPQIPEDFSEMSV